MKHLCILTRGTDLYQPLVNKLKSSFFCTDIRTISSSTSKEELVQFKGLQPFFSSGIYFDVSVDNLDEFESYKLIRELMSFRNGTLVVYTRNKKVYDYCLNHLEDCKGLDCGNPSVPILNLYIETYSSKKFTSKGVHELHKRMKFQWQLLKDYLIVLEDLDKEYINEVDVKSKVPTATYSYSPFRLLNRLITKERLDFEVKTMENYKYAHRYVTKTLGDSIDVTIKFKKMYLTGDLTKLNLHEVAAQEHINVNTMTYIFDNILCKVSTEMLYKYKYVIQKNMNKLDGFLLILLEVRGL